ncbi:MAG: hypothetical protein WA001_03250 [Patescibacteria group bacterium]
MTLPRPLVIALCAVPWVVALGAFLLLFIVRYPVSGIFVATTVVDGKSAWINPFLPAERASTPGLQPDGWTGQRMTDDPTYFTARVPGPYQSVDVTLEYRPIHQPLLEFGMVLDPQGNDLALQPLYSSQLNPAQWTRESVGSVTGYVRNGVLPSRLTSTDPTGIETWDASATMPLLADPAGAAVSTPVSLRGSHDFYLVPAGGAIHATFTLQAANRTTGSDIAVFRIFRGTDEISREAFAANGTRDARMDQTMQHTIDVPNASPGVYRISFVADDDVFIRNVDTTSKQWVVGPRLYFGDTVGYSTTTFPGVALTNSRHIVAETFHDEGLQKVTFGAVSANVSATHVATRLDRTDSQAAPVQLSAPRGDVEIIGDGFFALRPDAYFDPMPRRFTDATVVDQEQVQAVITDYTQPQSLGDGWYKSTFTFPLDQTLDHLRFVLSAPGIASRDGAVDVRRITLAYHRPTSGFSDWFHIIRQELANAWHRL